jgi:hypothetical protein
MNWLNRYKGSEDMHSLRLVGTRARRVLVVSLLLLAALTFVALPAEGQTPQSPTATVTFKDNGNCTVTVTYAWSGFKGNILLAEYGVTWPGPGGTHFAALLNIRDVTGSGTSGPHTFDLTGYGTNTYSGFGLLINKQGKTLSGSDVSSPTSADLSC